MKKNDQCLGYSANLEFAGVFMFGALITQIFVYTIKFMTGYHRPYFLSLCRPNIRSSQLSHFLQIQFASILLFTFVKVCV